MSSGSKPVLCVRTKPHHRSRDITGLRSGMLVAKSYAGSDGHKSYWLGSCDCGETITMAASEFRKMKQKSCGCSRGAAISAAKTTHGMSRHPAFAVWRSMIDRCGLPTHQAWANYGARGITVCEHWRGSFDAFWADMGPTYSKGLALDRIDNDQGYSKQNCRWVSYQTQARNTRSNRRIDTPQGKMLICEAAELSGIGQTTLQYRVDHNWPTAKLFEKPDSTNRFSTS